MGNLSLNAENSHDVILDLIYQIKIKDVMTKNPYTISPDQSMAEAKVFMKEKSITGLPVVRDKWLLGIITIYDILECLDNGRIIEPVKNHMSKHLTVLEEDMPISFALSYFEKYHFRRFPVLNKQKELCGIITGRDTNITLLAEVNKKLKEIDGSKTVEEKDIKGGSYYRIFNIRKFDFENAGKASISIKKILKEKGIKQDIIRRVSIAVYELEINQVVHSDGGTIQFIVENNAIIIKANDTGPGIVELDKVLEEGYSTASEWIRSQGFGAGMGLPNVKKVSDDFQITSSLEKGTEVTIKIFMGAKDETV